MGGDCLGIVKHEYMQAASGDSELVDKLVAVLIEQRSEAREQKDFATADVIRKKLEKIGIVLEDKPDWTEWRKK